MQRRLCKKDKFRIKRISYEWSKCHAYAKRKKKTMSCQLGISGCE